MWSGDVIADRFVLERPIGSGGEGTVFLAADRVDGTHVAVKLLDGTWDGAIERFRREARVLSTLTHPGIVRYVAHGEARTGQPFLAMEWLDGENLAQRLARGGLTLDESLGLARRAAEALGFAHGQGVVHRDVKPSNLFLVGSSFDRVKLLDFGLARPETRSQVLTQPGAMLGTVGYMAPEQVMQPESVDARADIFGLGCVLYECLTGRPPFAAEHAVAVLAKLLRADPPRVSDLKPDVGDRLDPLMSRMLAKSPGDRPAGAAQVLLALEAARGLGSSLTAPSTPRTPGSITHAEQRVVSVILMEPEHDPATLATTTPERADNESVRVRAITAQFATEAMPLTSGAWLVVLSGKGAATDRATLACSCALALHQDQRGYRTAVATGRADITGRLPVGPAIDRAAALLRTPRGSEGVAGVTIDDATAGLLGPQFDVRRTGALSVLWTERADVGAPRLLLGKPTPYVGRQKELAILDAILEECLSESVARAALVTGPPGIGKSRLRTEFLNMVAPRRHVTVLEARANQTQAGSSFALIRQLLRVASGLSDRDPVEVQLSKIRNRLARRLEGDELSRSSEFLAELLGVPLEGSISPLLRAARDDARIMSAWMRRAFEAWLVAECAWAPVLIALEDLHWGDSASIAFLTEAFRKMPEEALMIVAFARPSVDDSHPHFGAFGASIPIQELVLAGLTKRPAQQLVEAVLGPDVSHDIGARVINLADGNAFYLEELIRAVAEGRSGELPETVVAMAQARLDGLSPEARRILRAAAIFGDVFSESAVVAPLGPTFAPAEIGDWFRTLIELEFLVPVRDDGLGDRTAYAFRHGLLREAAYATLTDADRANGHRLAAEWLVKTDEKDALVIAEHFERGGCPREALPWRLRAAEVALNAGHTDLAMSISAEGLRLAEQELRGRFLETQQIALAFRGDWSEAFDVAEAAMALLPPGSTPWFRSAGTRIVCAIYLGRPAAVLQVLRIGASLPAPSPTGPFGLAVQMIVASLLHAGARAMAIPFARRIDEAADSGQPLDPVFTGWRHTVHATLELFLHDRIAPAIEHTSEALRSFDFAADFVGWSMACLYQGIAHVEAGAFETARGLLTPVAARTEALLLPAVDFAKYYLARMDAVSGVTASSEALLNAPPGIADGARAFLAEAHLQNGNADLAEQQARTVEKSASCYARVTALSVLARVELGRGRPREAIELIDTAIEDQDRGSIVPFWRSTLLLARAEALMRADERELALGAIRAARERLLRIGGAFADATIREGYLTGLPVHSRTFALAREWLAV